MPQLLFGIYTKTRLTPAGWWGEFDYLLLWRSERFFPPLVSTGTLGLGGELLFGNELAGGNLHSGFRFDGGIWLYECFGVGSSVILVGTDGVRFDRDTTQVPTLARPYIDALTGLPASLSLEDPGSIKVNGTNSFWSLDGYVRGELLSGKRWSIDALAGLAYMQLQDNLDVSSTASNVISRRSDHFDCLNQFYSGIGGLVGEYSMGRWRVNLWGRLAFGNMVERTEISGNRDTLLAPNVNQGFLALDSNIGTHKDNLFELIPIAGANLYMKIWCGVHASIGYIGIFIPKVLLSGNEVNTTLDLTQTIAEPSYQSHNRSFWMQGFSIGLTAFY